ncbi:MAG: hypothetical protein COU10_03535 [Candidatus Harrisonbacteria bacterium CG10_big_fil_rev_8_21_14_0_10_45_28]|uniref:Guanylate kinase-like domain-containing protein n=1 Tax=Candidatus Harrisonbacteria bacterium CG10_big_fil_rev_8_21_14_0_10_45_28 TaxID=1974586 RepID=A0A2H0UPC7_9BACT|nr:MAG: hypothetical protein COU10_03535 [Candidatus Harrisonbacteria bacterium CG10_big_fil_rev_8_21_14_0_10_45_28]
MQDGLFFLGESGVGKSTLMRGLVSLCVGYHKPQMVMTRQPRTSDAPGDYEYVTVDEFLRLRESGQLSYAFDDGIRYYGYRREKLEVPSKALLLYGSPYAVRQILAAKGRIILIVGDSRKGLRLRGVTEAELIERSTINGRLARRFYSTIAFRGLMDGIFENPFTSLNVLCIAFDQLISRILLSGKNEVYS